MANAWVLSALWVGLALLATLLAIWFQVSTALSEIIVGTVAQLIIGAFFGAGGLLGSTQWITFLAGTGAIVLTFLAGAELDPVIFKTKWKEALRRRAGRLHRSVSRLHAGRPLPPRLDACAQLAVRRGAFHDLRGRGLCGHAGTRLQRHRLRQVDPGRLLRQRPGNRHCAGADLLALHAQDADLRRRLAVLFVVLPYLTPRFFKQYGGRSPSWKPNTSCFRLFGLGGLAVWAGSEAVLPAYMIGTVLAGTVGKDHMLIRRLRTLTFGLLTPFYFIRAGSFVSVPALIAAPATLLVLFRAKMAVQDGCRVSGSAAQSRRSRWNLLHADDVDRPHLRHHLGAVRPQSPDHHPGAVFLPGGRGHRQRRAAHADRQHVLSASPSASPSESKKAEKEVMRPVPAEEG